MFAQSGIAGSSILKPGDVLTITPIENFSGRNVILELRVFVVSSSKANISLYPNLYDNLQVLLSGTPFKSQVYNGFRLPPVPCTKQGTNEVFFIQEIPTRFPKIRHPAPRTKIDISVNGANLNDGEGWIVSQASVRDIS